MAKFYFPDSEVEFQMKITVGEKPDEQYITQEKKSAPKSEPKKENKSKTEPKSVETTNKPKEDIKPIQKKKAPAKKKDEEPEIIQFSLF